VEDGKDLAEVLCALEGVRHRHAPSSGGHYFRRFPSSRVATILFRSPRTTAEADPSPQIDNVEADGNGRR
jgi:hypothetical protein